jgi:hypothetical protein
MNPFDFVKAAHGGGDSMMPILIFVIWIALSFFSNAKKKKKKLEQQKAKLQARGAYHAPAVPAPAPAAGERMTHKEEIRSSAYDEIRRELETVLSQGRTTGVSAPEAQLEDNNFSLETREKEEASYEVQAHPEAVPPVKVPQPAPPFPDFAFNAYDTGAIGGIETSAITDIFSSEPHEKCAAQLTVNHEDARTGIIWSEILGAPKSLRDTF